GGPQPAGGAQDSQSVFPGATSREETLDPLSTRRGSAPYRREAAMSQVRVHNFSISLDGFGTGDGITFDAPFGHAGERLHEWMFATRFWRSMVGDTGGSPGVDH